jgi:hypothetical protein
VDADQPLKVLFRTRPADLLPLLGDAGAEVLSARVLELAAAKRSVDLVLVLRRGRERYVRHVEFQTRHRSDLARRCFEYATRLVVELRLPVLTTVVYMKPPAPRELVFREALGGRVLSERRFDVVRLYELEAREALSLGPGGAALVGLLGGTTLDVIAQASRRIRQRAPEAEQADLLAILQCLSEGRYTARRLARVIPEEVVMGSSIFDKARQMGFERGLARGIERGIEKGIEKGIGRGLAQGRLAEARELCAAVVKRHHRGIAARVLPAVTACTDVRRLHAWTLRAPEASSVELLRLVGRAPARASSRSRTPRPARRSGRSRSARDRA